MSEIWAKPRRPNKRSQRLADLFMFSGLEILEIYEHINSEEYEQKALTLKAT